MTTYEAPEILLTDIADGQILKYHAASGKFLNADESGGGGATTFVTLTDVDISDPADGDRVQWDADSSKWVAVGPSTATMPYPSSPVFDYGANGDTPMMTWDGKDPSGDPPPAGFDHAEWVSLVSDISDEAGAHPTLITVSEPDFPEGMPDGAPGAPWSNFAGVTTSAADVSSATSSDSFDVDFSAALDEDPGTTVLPLYLATLDMDPGHPNMIMAAVVDVTTGDPVPNPAASTYFQLILAPTIGEDDKLNAIVVSISYVTGYGCSIYAIVDGAYVGILGSISSGSPINPFEPASEFVYGACIDQDGLVVVGQLAGTSIIPLCSGQISDFEASPFHGVTRNGVAVAFGLGADATAAQTATLVQVFPVPDALGPQLYNIWGSQRESGAVAIPGEALLGTYSAGQTMYLRLVNEAGTPGPLNGAVTEALTAAGGAALGTVEAILPSVMTGWGGSSSVYGEWGPVVAGDPWTGLVGLGNATPGDNTDEYISIPFALESGTEYDVYVFHSVGPDHGKLQIGVRQPWYVNVVDDDDAEVFWDCYAADPGYLMEKIGTLTTSSGAAPKNTTLQIYSYGKNDDSTGYHVELYGVYFVPPTP